MLTDRVIETCRRIGSPMIVGIDPAVEKLPRELLQYSVSKYGENERGFAHAFEAFGKSVIDAVEGIACIVKPQLAYFETLGFAGMEAYSEIVRYAKMRGFFVIADAKRGDIGSTSSAYARAFLGDGSFSADFVTVNPYLGSDCVDEFLRYVDENDKGMFVLVKTSNPSGAEVQDLITVDGSRVYEVIGRYVEERSRSRIGAYGYSNVGAVVGATHPAELARLRSQMPSVPFLVPGYGAQGGTASDIKAAFDAKGNGAYINSSRGIIYAKEEGVCFMDAMRNAALRMREDLRKDFHGSEADSDENK